MTMDKTTVGVYRKPLTKFILMLVERDFIYQRPDGWWVSGSYGDVDEGDWHTTKIPKTIGVVISAITYGKDLP